MLKFEEYLNDFSATISLRDYLIGFLITVILALLIRYYYIHFGSSISNRKRFANTFLPLALGTMLIITIVKSSLALSLGLVGALSIVRFRAAIKDPEELTFLFLIIGLGLCTGANQFVLAIVGIPLIVILLWANRKMQGLKRSDLESQKMVLHISSRTTDSNNISDIVTAHASNVELRRLDEKDATLTMSFLVLVESLDEINRISDQLKTADPDIRISFVEQADFAL